MLLAKFIPECYAFHYSPKRGIPLPGFPLGLAWDTRYNSKNFNFNFYSVSITLLVQLHLPEFYWRGTK